MHLGEGALTMKLLYHMRTAAALSFPPISEVSPYPLLALCGRSPSDTRSHGGSLDFVRQYGLGLETWLATCSPARSLEPPVVLNTALPHFFAAQIFHSNRIDNSGPRCQPGSTSCRPPFLRMADGYLRNQDRLRVPCGRNRRIMLHRHNVKALFEPSTTAYLIKQEMTLSQ